MTVDYSAIGRDRLIAYCEDMRRILEDAEPLRWLMTGDTIAATAWDARASALLGTIRLQCGRTDSTRCPVCGFQAGSGACQKIHP